MEQKLQQYLELKQELVDKELTRLITGLPLDSRLKNSMLYSVEAGGKRLRPILLMATYEALGGKGEEVISVACAVEMVHTYSLIHDDLPAMDNDDLRRGLPTNHKKFDEATAILAGDALLTYSFEVLAKADVTPVELKLELVQLLAKAAGPEGMVGGQLLDMEAENREITLKELETIHSMKTGELLQFSIIAGAKLGKATKKQLQSISEFSRLLGIIFQVQDDILDVSGDSEKMGKPVGSDRTNFKSTYPGLLGLDGAIEKKQEYSQAARHALKEAGIENSVLISVADYLGSRDY